MKLTDAPNAYVRTLYWSTSTCEALTVDGITYPDGAAVSQLPVTQKQRIESAGEAEKECLKFAALCEKELGINPFEWFDEGDVAYALVLSRNGHGAGFFDSTWEVRTKHKGILVQEKNLAQELQHVAKSMGEHTLMAWVDGRGNLQLEEYA